ncbi:ATPase [Staphylothermus hellenicus]|uniref:H+transporting two-sector ATPase C subunit n=1 Tax=Staphylothermus hellenicus (strain DSM 12710 / JCM 10830 / BK20S6-10-b1 / P8) TaxID=591019 RepID=D7D9E3_STAHD|nr:ATPase [Staphylothermus hellenicus]ADI32389.1 H+transporting two-sector ATPase C subunit [Staphylothermus hellenicus DSM 12710]
MDQLAVGLAYASAAFALMGGLIGSSIGIGKAGSAGSAALAEDPKQFRNVFILASLPMTQTFYGLIILIQYISYVNGHLETLTLDKALAILGLGLAVAVAEFFSAWFQGIVCASGISELPRTKGAVTFSTMILAVYVELIGILGMVFGLLGLSLIG